MPILKLADCEPLFDAKGYARFAGTIDWNDLQYSKNKGTPNYCLRLKVSGGVHDGKHAFAHYYLSPAAIEKSIEGLERALNQAFPKGNWGECMEMLQNGNWVGQAVTWSMRQRKNQDGELIAEVEVSGVWADKPRATKNDWARLRAMYGGQAPPAAQPAASQSGAGEELDALPF